MAMDRENRSFSFAEWDAEIDRLRRKLAKAKRKAAKLRKQRDEARAVAEDRDREWPFDLGPVWAGRASANSVREARGLPGLPSAAQEPATAPSASGPVSDSPKPEIAAYGPLRGAEGRASRPRPPRLADPITRPENPAIAWPDYAQGEQP